LLLYSGILAVVVILLAHTRTPAPSSKLEMVADTRAAGVADRTFASRASRSASAARLGEVLEDTTTTTAVPVVEAATVAAKPTPTTAKPRPTTTTTRPRPTTTTTAAPTNEQSGQASWYQAANGTCAHKTLPFGTVVTVTNVGTGASVQCRVADRGPYAGGRIIDLDKETFGQIASTSSGVISARITW
jgi:rare lipoprotein A